MLLFQGRGPKLVLAVAFVLTLAIVLHLSSFPALAEWKLPSTSGWKFPLTGGSAEQDEKATPASELPGQDAAGQHNSPDDKPEWDLPIEDEPSAQPTSWQVSISTAPSTLYANSSHSTSSRPFSSIATTTSTDLPSKTGEGQIKPTEWPCQKLPGSEDVLVVMRTGATETEDKLPAHLNTTFNCFPETVIFSDYEENFLGHQIYDVLKNIPDEVKQGKQFEHYLHVQAVGRKGLDPSELSGAVSEETGDGTGKGDNPGWALDKWKFLPMINETFALHPDKKWYVFIEPDSYLVWSNFLQWLPHLDPNKSSYFGSEAMIGDLIFAHGGSVFLLTRPAMEKVYNDFNNRTAELFEYIAQSWAGDGVLAKVLHDNGVPLTFTWPQFQGGNPAYTTDWEGEKGDSSLWCAPALSYHHLIPSEVVDMFRFEQGWIEDVHERFVDRDSLLWRSDAETLLHHMDTFKLYIQRNMTHEREDWDAKNNVDEAHPPTRGLDLSGCRARCEAESSCLQYTLGPEGCITHLSGARGPRLGQYRKGFRSGWMKDRVQKWVEKMDHCGKTGWTTP